MEATLEMILNSFQDMKRSIDKRFDEVETRLDKMETRLDKMDTRLDKMGTRLDRLEEKVDTIAKVSYIIQEQVIRNSEDISALKLNMKEDFTVMKDDLDFLKDLHYEKSKEIDRRFWALQSRKKQEEASSNS
ncbi:RmuC family protein [Thermoactinomyces sp. DSM 45891]|uniref:DNA recombination protein RmuC n=1 Tax=Thermoactinomyces sp. DSM 45891 TaxID=1761907 RepID=UPI000914F9D2|nr:DNA recombination protein RmuC [Thermoactinomyces sp. DSM 45891]SFX09266.1 RmuC family protein [Thermoactinomyces sp. DSM 45891]